MTEDSRTGPSTGPPNDAFHWEMFRNPHPRQRDWSDGVVVTGMHLIGVGAACVAAPLIGLALGTIFAVFWGSLLIPPWLRDRRSVVSVDIRPGPPAVLVLRQRRGTETTRPLSSVTEMRPLTVGYRSTDSRGDSILELRVGRRTYRTRAAYNPPANDVQLLADALRLACPQIVAGRHENKTTWVTDAG
ncbi:hypothetical protein [Streptomyces sp. NPDC048442]|uniref:hypothetical protein n=1 Tax=Streptomyces sp. NPDC048442 TaxID=3154823 RepID=UPI003427161F